MGTSLFSASSINNRFITALLVIVASLFIYACSSSTPHEDLIKRQISSLLIKDTMGKLFEVTSVTIKHSHLTNEGDFVVDADYSLKYTHTLQSYMDYMFEDTQVNSRIDGSELKKEVQAELIKKYGRPRVGDVRSMNDQFIFRQEAFGWEIQSFRDMDKIKPFLK